MTNQLFADYAFDDNGAAIVGASVSLYTRNTTTPVLATTTTDANGYWAISYATEGRYDIEVVNGTTKRRRKWDTRTQFDTLEVATLRVRNPAFTFDYDIVPAAITADRQLNLPLITATDTLACLGLSQNFSVTQYIGDTANAQMTLGLTINQGANDNEALALKSSDVNHTETTRAEADTYFAIRKAVSATGGTDFRSLGSHAITSGTVLNLWAFGGAGDTTKTTAGRAYIELAASLIDGSGGAIPGADSNLVAILSHSTTRFLFDVEGSGHADVGWVAYDKQNDLALMDALQHEWGGRLTPARYGENPLYYNREYLEGVGIVGKDSWHVEHMPDGRVRLRSMVNFTKLAMLHHGALLQVGDRLAGLEHENALLRVETERLNRMLESRRD